MFCIVILAFLLTFYAFGSCFRTLPAILVSALYAIFHKLYIYIYIFGGHAFRVYNVSVAGSNPAHTGVAGVAGLFLGS